MSADRMTDARLILLSPKDNILVVTDRIAAGEEILIQARLVCLDHAVTMGHKIARQPIARGAPILKYGFPIGKAVQDIAMGAHVHVHNLESNYTKTHSLEQTSAGKTE